MDNPQYSVDNIRAHLTRGGFMVIGGFDMAARFSIRPLAYSTTAYSTIYYSPFTIHFSLSLHPASDNKLNLLVTFLPQSE